MAKRDDAEPLAYLALPSAEAVLAECKGGRQHAVARCRWCGGKFGEVYGSQWICPTLACAERQVARAMPKQAQYWQKGDSPFLYLPLPIGVELAESPHKRTLCAGAAGSAKSYTGRWFLYDQCRAMPGSRWLLLRCSYDELDKNHLQFIPAECEQLGDAEWSGGNVRRVTFTNDAKIFCGYCDDLADIPKHLGPEWDGIVFEEAVNFLERALSEISARDRGSQTAKRPTGVEKDGRTFCLTNPGGRGMMYLVDHYIRKDPDPAEYPHYNAEMHGHIPATLDDNPYLPENYATSNLSGLNAARYRQLRYGDWNVMVGQFFGQFTNDTHVVDMEAQ